MSGFHSLGKYFMAIDIVKVAHLANLTLSEKDKTTYAPQLENIFRLAEQMNAVPTDHIAPMAHPLDATQPLRADVPTETDQRSLFQSIAPATESGLYLVPVVIDAEKNKDSRDA
jgi:aspartyl-tRNA(Asn)/glutamyl-tRNA(Gln) amidotransferase subunit C